MAKNSTVFVRPNLKGFLVAASLLLIVQHLVSSGHSQGTGPRRLAIHARELSDGEIRELIRYASEHPSEAIYTRISNTYERRGEYRKALLFLRRAEKISQMQDSDE
jgi:hypothetical protein